MNDSIQFMLDALRYNPNDEAAWLVLADALEEAGQSERGEIIRLTTSLRKQECLRYRLLQRRLQELLLKGVKPCMPTVVNSLGIEMTLIPGGWFQMGSSVREAESYADERPRHKVQITRPFYMATFPITQQQFTAATGINPSRFCSTGQEKSRVEGLQTDDFPVEQVTWDAAMDFCDRLSAREEERSLGLRYRLPTEAEWEYACRAGTRTPFHFGREGSSNFANCDGRYPYGRAAQGDYLNRTCPVGNYIPNGFGLHDMHGNVLEWCSDWFDEHFYAQSPQQDPTGPTEGINRVLRGGGWSYYPRNCRAAYRGWEMSELSTQLIGMRVVCEWNSPG